MQFHMLKYEQNEDNCRQSTGFKKQLHKRGIRVERNNWFIAMLGVLCAKVVHFGAIGGR